MMRGQVLISLFCIVFFANAVNADEIVFTNGDRLTGKINHAVDGKMVFTSDLAGKVTVEMTKIKTFSTDEAVTVHLNDGNVLTQKIVGSTAGKFAIEDTETVKAQDFDVAAISSINPPPKPVPKWTGNVSAAVTSTHGNTKTELISASANLRKRTEKDRTTISADYARGEQEDPDTGETKKTEDWWRTKGKYDYFFSKKFYGYLDGRYETDKIAALDRRVIVGGGGGYQWIESENMNFSIEGGLASLYEKYENQTDSTSELSAQVGYNFDKTLVKNLKFIHDLTYYPSLDRFSDYYLTTTGELRAHFTERMFANFKAILNYDATPAIGAGSTDTKYILGLGYSF
jgi:putative salt-induced outer membrane protein YdiY